MKRIKLILILTFVILYTLLSAQDNFSGDALDFDGTDDYVNIGNDASLNTGNVLTVEAWIKPTDLSTRQGIYSTRKNNRSGSFQLEVGPGSGGTNRVVVTGVNTWIAQTNDNAIVPNQWNHIVYTRSGTGSGTHKIYVNGEEQTLISDADYIFVDNTDDKVIASGTNGGYFFSGLMDEVRIWNVALDSTQIRENMCRTLSGSETGLISYWQFNDGSGTTASDLISGNQGTLTNMTDDDWVNSTAPVPFESGSDGNWSEAANWLDGQGSPSKSWSRVKINSNITLDEDKEVIEITTESGKTFTINNGKTLTVSGSSNGN